MVLLLPLRFLRFLLFLLDDPSVVDEGGTGGFFSGSPIVLAVRGHLLSLLSLVLKNEVPWSSYDLGAVTSFDCNAAPADLGDSTSIGL